MTLDLSKLSPMPWTWEEHPRAAYKHYEGKLGKFVDHRGLAVCSFGNSESDYQQCGAEPSKDNIEFITLATKAFDIMMRRGWGCSHGPRGWWVNCPMEVCLKFGVNFKMEPFPDPFTALVEAEKWYVEHVENVEKQ